MSGKVNLRAGSEDSVVLQLLQDDGVTPIDLTGWTNLSLKLKAGGSIVKTFTAPQFTLLDAAQGKVKLLQIAADFPDAARYEYYVTATDSGSLARAVPEDRNYDWIIKAA